MFSTFPYFQNRIYKFIHAKVENIKGQKCWDKSGAFVVIGAKYQEPTYHPNPWSSKLVIKERITKSEKGYLCKNYSKKIRNNINF